MRVTRLALNITCLLVAGLASAQAVPNAKKILAGAQQRAEQIHDKATKAELLAGIAEAWQPLDKNIALACLTEATEQLPPDSNAWQEVLRVWMKQNPDTAIEHALALSGDKGADRLGEVVASEAATDIAKAAAMLAKIPNKQRQRAAEVAVTQLCDQTEDACEPFIQSISGVNSDALYAIVARQVEDPQLSLKAARLAGKEKSAALTEAVRKNAQNNPAIARGLIGEIDDVNDRALALAYCAQAYKTSNEDAAKQCAQAAILLYNQTPPEWSTRPNLFVRIEPYLSDIDSPEVRELLQRFTEFVDSHFNNAGDDDVRSAPYWYIVCASAWSSLDIEKARQYVGRALQADPAAGVDMTDSAHPHILPAYERFLVRLMNVDSQDAAAQIAALKSVSSSTFHEAATQVLQDLEPGNRDQARDIAKQLGGDFPNVAEALMDFYVMTPDAAADGLLRIESDSFNDQEFAEYSDRFVDTLIQADPYRASRAIINLNSAGHRVPLLSKLIIAIAKSNSSLATSLLDKARQDAEMNMDPAAKVQAEISLAKAAIALNL